MADVHIFFDESGTSSSDRFLLAGATAYYEVAAAEERIREARDRALGDSALWSRPSARSAFETTGFHYTEDNESVRQVLLNTLETVEFRAYCAYSKNERGTDNVDRLINMYAVLLRGLALRYREHRLVFVFEENNSMDRLYSKIWAQVAAELEVELDVTVLRGKKDAPCLAVTDYVLGVTRQHMAEDAREFEQRRFASLGSKYAYLIDFDDDRHYGGSRRPIL